MKNYEVLWTKEASLDLENIIGYIYEESHTIAKEVYLAIKEHCSTLEYFPLRGRVVPEMKTLGILDYRELIYQRWRIIYTMEAQNVYLLLIIDSRQDMQEQLITRFINSELK
ncbi:type II toxin-antitoxin system RelE/ParE family toxin [Sulfurovum sp. NBC37-1]|uniref:type II toxin-antitoxin system RelE/ParE family toxin n=1 Tax=Sulfurovum sp. (strain NBC37-1) TaxID=387093 RepID=UPI0001587D4F|nr:type II toxin-antitoxin system RelE/ParE family toxin [Sulfurovum sp. NBC37-1]BAF72320.1 plasmid stabilization system protein [Sulfurovum sp. NBC37-1]